MNTERTHRHATELAEYCRQRGYNDHIMLLWDLSLHSGKRRFTVWNTDTDKAEYVFVASHGSGSQRSHIRSSFARTSDKDNSHLSSLGRALIGKRYEGRYGTAYRMDGLDDTNSSIRQRNIVLHGWRFTSDYPIWPFPTVGSWGCPVLSVRAMKIMDKILQQHERVVLWTYND